MWISVRRRVIHHPYRTARVVPVVTFHGREAWEMYDSLAKARGFKMDNHTVIEDVDTGIGIQCSDNTLTIGPVIRENW